jgi:cobalt-precorrin 5A hydrolase / precorrin-3B C17-methyltransferase
VSLIVGVGARPGVSADDLDALIGKALAATGLDPARVVALATIDRRAAEPGMIEVAARRGWPLVGYPADQLAGEEAVPHPSALAEAAIGTASVAEAAALRAVRDCGGDPILLVGKRTSGTATVAVAAPAGTADAYGHGLDRHSLETT